MEFEDMKSHSNNVDFKFLESPKALVVGECDEEDDESKSLLPSKKGGLSKKSKNQKPKSKRRVQWLDRNGDKLEQILEFQTREASLDEAKTDPCFCKIM